MTLARVDEGPLHAVGDDHPLGNLPDRRVVKRRFVATK